MILFPFLAKNNNEKKIEKLKTTLVLEIWQQQWFDKDEQKYMKIWRYKFFLKTTTTIDTSDCGVGEIIKGKEKTLNVVLKGAQRAGTSCFNSFRGGKKFSDRIRASC